MNIRFHERGQMTDATLAVVERLAETVSERLPDVATGNKHLNVTVGRNPRDETHTAKLVLRVPRQHIAVSGVGTAQDLAMRDAFEDLLDRLKVYRAKQSGEPEIRREGKFHVSKIALARDALDAVQGWPEEPPRTEEDLAPWIEAVEKSGVDT